MEKLHDKIMDLLREEAKLDDKYINPHFLTELSNLLYRFYEIEDYDVDKWIQDSFGR